MLIANPLQLGNDWGDKAQVGDAGVVVRWHEDGLSSYIQVFRAEWTASLTVGRFFKNVTLHGCGAVGVGDKGRHTRDRGHTDSSFNDFRGPNGCAQIRWSNLKNLILVHWQQASNIEGYTVTTVGIAGGIMKLEKGLEYPSTDCPAC